MNTPVTRKPIITTSEIDILDPSVKFQKKRFDGLIWDKGYDVWIDKAMRCPCIQKSTGQGLPNCRNCLGKGWLFINRSETRIVIQSLNANKKYENWTEETTGTAKITARAIDRLAWMDRITIINAEGIFQEVLFPTQFNGELIAFPIYTPLEIFECYLFDGVTNKLKILELVTDYTISDEKIIFNNNYINNQQFSVSIRYAHCLVYHVTDINRDVMVTRVRDCDDETSASAQMPINGMAKKAHYIFDNTKFEANKLLENSKQITT
jgi:hypothetical protein